MSLVEGEQNPEFLVSPGPVVDVGRQGVDPLVAALDVGAVESLLLEVQRHLFPFPMFFQIVHFLQQLYFLRSSKQILRVSTILIFLASDFPLKNSE